MTSTLYARRNEQGALIVGAMINGWQSSDFPAAAGVRANPRILFSEPDHEEGSPRALFSVQFLGEAGDSRDRRATQRLKCFLKACRDMKIELQEDMGFLDGIPVAQVLISRGLNGIYQRRTAKMRNAGRVPAVNGAVSAS